jgi:hypothetical protein
VAVFALRNGLSVGSSIDDVDADIIRMDSYGEVFNYTLAFPNRTQAGAATSSRLIRSAISVRSFVY